MSKRGQYDVLQLSDEQVLETEQLGSKSKFWVNINDDGEDQDWLFKIPRKNTGEHWAEKVAAEVASLLDIPHAKVELAQFRGTKGSCSKSFINTKKKPELIHGNEILAGRVLGYEKNKRYGQRNHTYRNIRQAIIKTSDEVKPERALKHFAGYLVLDALIGNTDRHHENWAFLKWTDGQKQMHRILAPTFDHASSLGRELLDEKREIYLKEDRVAWYIKRGNGAIYANAEDKKGLNPFKLIEFACRQHFAIFKPWIEKADKIKSQSFKDILNKVPDNYISDTERTFAYKILKINKQNLTNLLS